MKGYTRQKFHAYFYELKISYAEFKYLDQTYVYQYMKYGIFKFGVKDFHYIEYKAENYKIPEAIPENRITIFDYSNNKVITLPFEIEEPMSPLELFAYILEKHGYDISKMNYLITTNEKNDTN